MNVGQERIEEELKSAGAQKKTKGSGLFVVNHWALGERCKTKSPDPFVLSGQFVTTPYCRYARRGSRLKPG